MNRVNVLYLWVWMGVLLRLRRLLRLMEAPFRVSILRMLLFLIRRVGMLSIGFGLLVLSLMLIRLRLRMLRGKYRLVFMLRMLFLGCRVRLMMVIGRLLLVRRLLLVVCVRLLRRLLGRCRRCCHVSARLSLFRCGGLVLFRGRLIALFRLRLLLPLLLGLARALWLPSLCGDVLCRILLLLVLGLLLDRCLRRVGLRLLGFLRFRLLLLVVCYGYRV